MNKIEKPLISVILPNYNWVEFLEEAIKSILNQSYDNFEFIIIDDASTDKSIDIIKKYTNQDKRIILLENKKNEWICFSLNRWIKVSKWKYIARMDSDDISNKKRFEKQVYILEKDKSIWICWTNAFIINEAWKINWKFCFPMENDKCKEIIWERNPFKHSSTMIRKKCFDDFWFYNDNFIYAEDLDLWIRIWQKYNFFNIQEYLIKYRVHKSNSILKKQKEMIEKTLKIRKKAIYMWYKITFRGRIFYILTFFSKFLPSLFTLILFKIFYGKK